MKLNILPKKKLETQTHQDWKKNTFFVLIDSVVCLGQVEGVLVSEHVLPVRIWSTQDLEFSKA